MKKETETIKVWVSDECDSWDIEIPAGANIEKAVRGDVCHADYGDGGRSLEREESQHICIEFGVYDEDGEREREGKFTATRHPQAWNDGEGWEEETVRGNKGGVKIWYRKDNMVAVLDTWYQFPHNGQVCENDHIVIEEMDE